MAEDEQRAVSPAMQNPAEQMGRSTQASAGPSIFARVRDAVNWAFSGTTTDQPERRTYALDEALLNEIIRSKMSPMGKGRPVEGIPHTNPDPTKRSITVMDAATGQIVSVGDMEHRFSQQSMSKPTAMALAIELMGSEKAYRQYVGVEASGRPYNDPALLPDGRAFNSSVNAGALSTWVLIMAHTPEGKDPLDLYMDKMKALTGNPHLEINKEMANGEHKYRPQDGGKSGNQKLLDVLDNAGLMQVLEKRFGELTSEQGQQRKQDLMDKAFENYCMACAVMVNTRDMAAVAGVYRNGGMRVDASGEVIQVLPKEIAEYVHGSNAVSGSYNESGTQFAKNRFSGKTGVDGGIFGSLLGHPDLVVATHHSDLNAAGNSGEGQKWIGTLDKLDVAFPENTGSAMMPGTYHDLRTMQKGELGESPREMDDRLRSETQRNVLDAIEADLRSQGQEGGFYLKSPDLSNGKDPLKGGETVAVQENVDGRPQRYTIAQSNHNRTQVKVTDEQGRPNPLGLSAVPRDAGYWEELNNKINTMQVDDPQITDRPQTVRGPRP
jgi:glutaminase